MALSRSGKQLILAVFAILLLVIGLLMWNSLAIIQKIIIIATPVAVSV